MNRKSFCHVFFRRLKKSPSTKELFRKSSSLARKESSSNLPARDELFVTPDCCVLQKFKNYKSQTFRLKEPLFQESCDVLVIGGGAIGSSCAYWLKTLGPNRAKVTVVEKDPTYRKCSTTLSVGGLRQQFSLPESIQMSLFGAEFLRTMKSKLGIEGHPPPDANFETDGYLSLATEKGASVLKNNSDLQNKLGAKNILLSREELRKRFPWLNVNEIELGCLGIENEGWFDPWSLLNALRKKSIDLGADYKDYEVVGMEFQRDNQPVKAIVKRKDGTLGLINFTNCIIAAGAYSGRIGNFLKFGIDEKNCAVPVEPRKRYVYCFHSPDGPGTKVPLTVDPNGTYFRREGSRGDYICGVSPSPEEEPNVEDLEVDYELFERKIWPTLAYRVPAFEKLKLKSAWAGYYEYNCLDQNGIVGRHSNFANIYFATGFSGHGIQHSPAIGRALAELILEGRYLSIDLSRLSFNRIIKNQPLLENNIW